MIDDRLGGVLDHLLIIDHGQYSHGTVSLILRQYIIDTQPEQYSLHRLLGQQLTGQEKKTQQEIMFSGVFGIWLMEMIYNVLRLLKSSVGLTYINGCKLILQIYYMYKDY